MDGWMDGHVHVEKLALQFEEHFFIVMVFTCNASRFLNSHIIIVIFRTCFIAMFTYSLSSQPQLFSYTGKSGERNLFGTVPNSKTNNLPEILSPRGTVLILNIFSAAYCLGAGPPIMGGGQPSNVGGPMKKIIHSFFASAALIYCSHVKLINK
jgi:hypothetical protein